MVLEWAQESEKGIWNVFKWGRLWNSQGDIRSAVPMVQTAIYIQLERCYSGLTSQNIGLSVIVFITLKRLPLIGFDVFVNIHLTH